MTEEKKKKILNLFVHIISYVISIILFGAIASGFMYLLDKIPESAVAIEIYKWITSGCLTIFTISLLSDILNLNNDKKDELKKSKSGTMKIYDE